MSVFIGIYSTANAVTLLGLVSAIMSCFLASQGNFKFAVVMLMLSSVCDLFDGKIARANPNRTEKDKLYGIQLDSICDVISFGVTPAFIAYNLGFQKAVDLVIYLFFIVCGAIRLSYFNTLAISNPSKAQKTFRGVPIPTSSFALPVLMVLMLFIPANVTVWLCRLMFLILGLLYILNIKVKKPSARSITVFTVGQVIVLLILLFSKGFKLP